MSTDNIDHGTGHENDSTLPPEAIGIDAVYLAIPSPLTDLFFVEERPNDYSLFRLGDTLPLASGIKNGQKFQIPQDGPPMWTLTVHFHEDKLTQQQKAHGTWESANGGQEDGGTYTAQSGGGVPTGKSASA